MTYLPNKRSLYKIQGNAITSNFKDHSRNKIRHHQEEGANQRLEHVNIWPLKAYILLHLMHYTFNMMMNIKLWYCKSFFIRSDKLNGKLNIYPAFIRKGVTTISHWCSWHQTSNFLIFFLSAAFYESAITYHAVNVHLQINEFTGINRTEAQQSLNVFVQSQRNPAKIYML